VFGFSLFRTYAGRPSRFQIFCLKGAPAAEVQGAACSQRARSLSQFSARCGLLSPHGNGDASQGDREPRTQLWASNDQDNPFLVSQPCDAYSSHDGTTGSEGNIVAG
jgi:hypothetical protein